MNWRTFILRNAPVLSAAWAVVIFILCATPGQFFPKSWWLELLSVDKLVHAGVFFILCVLLLLPPGGRSWGAVLWMLACVVYGVTLEIMQSTVFSHRSYDVADIVANSAGVIAGYFLAPRIRRWLARRAADAC